ncbi:MAG: PAS domain S-box protein [Thermoleophilaceae bacterium]
MTAAGFVGALALGARDARRDARHRAEVAAAQIHGRVQEGASLAESLRRYMVSVGGGGVSDEQFARDSSRWLSPAGVPAAAWVEQVAGSSRAAYERRIGHPIVTRDRRGRIALAGTRSSYLPATLVSGIAPMAAPGIDLGGEPGVTAALTRASSLYDAGATPLTALRDGAKGLLLIKFAPRLTRGIVTPGFVVIFLSDLWLRSAATGAPKVQLTAGGTSTAHHDGAAVEHDTFTEAGQRFDVAVPRASADGAAGVLPWIILAAGLVLAAVAGALGVNAARRSRAQDELDRIFTLSPEVIAVANFDGYFMRINPATEQILGYTREELLARPFLDFVHPDDRERTAAETAAVGEGKPTTAFENRFVRKDGSYKVLEWTSTPVVEDRLMYAVARDVTERRQDEAELQRLADEQAALRRVATLVAQDVPAAEVFSAVAGEVQRLLDAQATWIGRLESDATMSIVASNGSASHVMPVGSRLELESNMALTQVVRTGGSARVEDYSGASEAVLRRAEQLRIGSTVAVPIMVEGSLWGSIAAGTEREHFPADAEQRMTEFTELVGTAISNIQAREDLAGSRARIVAAADEERRRVVRDLHDGAQQRLVHSIITMKLAHQALPPDRKPAADLVHEALDEAESANVELRELAHGILPAVLAHGGLPAAVGALASRAPVPVDVDVSVDRLPAAAEATAYFVIAEALTNVAKHSRASHAAVVARVEDGALQLEVRDDGVGGAVPGGSGLLGVKDRLAVLHGRLRVESPAGGGTVVAADIPLHGEPVGQADGDRSVGSDRG